jgi:hypothetical protein
MGKKETRETKSNEPQREREREGFDEEGKGDVKGAEYKDDKEEFLKSALTA